MKKEKASSSSTIVRYEFPYIKLHGKFYPLIPLTLTHKSYTVKTIALIDSGATVSVFRPEIAKALRINMKQKPGISLGTVDGSLDVPLVPVKLKIQKTTFKARVGFSREPVATFNILGREGFFPKFSIAFNEIMKTVILVPLEKLSL